MRKTLFMALAAGAFVAGPAPYQPADAQTRQPYAYHYAPTPVVYTKRVIRGGVIVQHHLVSHTYVTAPRRTTRVAPMAANPRAARRIVK